MARRALLGAFLAFLVMNVLMVGTRPVLSPDETRYGSIAAQMAQSGDWLHLRMSGFCFYEKPPLTYWMTAASIKVFGQNAFAIRLPMALCTGLGALMLGMMVRRGARLAGRRSEEALAMGGVTALVYMTMVLPAVGGSVCILDAPLAGFVTAACACFFMGVTELNYARGRRVGWLVAAGVAAGLGFMVKGLPAIVFPALALAPWLAWERRWRELLLLPWIPLLVAAVVVAPWGIAIAQADPGFWHRFIVHEHFQRFAGGAANQPSEPFYFYLLVVPLGMVPWIILFPQAARWWPELLRRDSMVRLALCWVIGPLFLLSLSRGKLPTYALPVYPPLALLMTVGLWRVFETRPWRTGGWPALIAGGVLMLLALAALVLALGGTWTEPLLTRIWVDGGHWRAGVLALVLAIWGGMDWWATRARGAPQRLLRMGLSPVAPLAAFGLLFPTALVSDHAVPGRSMHVCEGELRGAPVLMTDAKMGHATAWFLGRTDFLVVGALEEFDNGLGIPQEDARRVPMNDLPARILSERARGPVVVAVYEGIARRLDRDQTLPPPARRMDWRGWSLLVYE